MYNKAATLHHLNTDAGFGENAGEGKERCSDGKSKMEEKRSTKLGQAGVDKTSGSTSTPLLSVERMKQCKSRFVQRYKFDKTPFFHYILFIQAVKTQLSPFERLNKECLCHQASWRELLYPEAGQ